MRMVKTVGTGAAAALVALTMVPLQSAVAATNPTLVLTPTSASTQQDQVHALTGSADTLVFSRQHLLAHDANDGAAADPDGSGARVLYVQGAPGAAKRLARVPTAYAYSLGSWSLTGSTLTAGVDEGDDGYPQITDVLEWQVPSGERRIVHLASGDNYLAAAPDGVVYSTPHGTVRVRTSSGAATLAAPFGVTTRPLQFGGSGPDGVVVGDMTGQAAYIPFAPPHTPVLLDGVAGAPLRCASVTAAYAACTSEPAEDDGYNAIGAYLLPLDGSAATVAPAQGESHADAASVAGSHLIFGYVNDSRADSGVYSQDVYSQAAGTTTATKVASGLWSDLVAASGDAVAGTVERTSLTSIDASDSVATIVAQQASPTTVDTFALASEQIVYADDQPVESRPDAVESAFVRSLRTSKGRVHAGDATLLSTGTDAVTGNLVGASNAIAVYATTGGTKPVTTTLHIRKRSGGTVAVPNAIGQGMVQVSGSEVLFQRWASGGSHVDVYDASTGKTRTVRVIHGGINYTGIALWKHYIAYATKHGAVYRQNFLTHKKVQLAKALPHDAGGVEFAVYEHGNWVGWSAQPMEGQLAKPLNKLRNAHTLKPAINLPHRLYSLTSAGALLDTTSTFRTGFSQQGLVTAATPFWLRSWSGHVTRLFKSRTYLAGPEIAGGRIAWAAGDGVLRVKRLTTG